MAHYLMLFKFTSKGAENIRESPQRIEALKETFKTKGAEVKEFFMLMGRYDTMFIVEAPSDEVMAQLLVVVGEHGYVQSETLRAFTMEEFRKIVER